MAAEKSGRDRTPARPRLYYAQTMPGVEQITWLEIRGRLPQARFREFLFAKEQNGVVVFENSGSPQELFRLRTAEDVFLLAFSIDRLTRDWGDLRRIAEEAQESAELDRALRSALPAQSRGSHTFRVVARQYGRHQYRRKDMEEAIVKGMERRYGRQWRPVEENADVEIWANVFGSRFIGGVRLSDRTMRHRYRREEEMPASLRPSVAAAMVWLTEPAEDEVFADPFCGSGTILLERSAHGPARALLGGDRLWEHTVLTRRNLTANARWAAAGGEAMQWDACHLPLATASVDKLATNPPFGKQMGSPGGVAALYRCFLAEVERVLRPEGRAVALSSEYELVKELMRERPGLEILTGYSVAVLGQWGRIYLIRRRP